MGEGSERDMMSHASNPSRPGHDLLRVWVPWLSPREQQHPVCVQGWNRGYGPGELPLDSSDCSTQTIWTHAQRLSFSPLVCRLRNSSEVLYLLTWARAWNLNFSPWNISYVLRRYKNVFGATILNRLTLLNYHVVIKTCMSDVRNIHRRCSRFSTPSGALRT